MLNMSGLRPAHDGLFAFQPVPGELSSPRNDDLAFVRRFVASLENGGIGALVIDAAQATIALNARGRAILGRSAGERMLKQKILDHMRGAPGLSGCFVWRRPRRPLVFVRWFRLAGGGDGPTALLLMEASDFDALRLAAFVRCHGITPAEAKVLEALLGGASPGDIAAELALSLPTVKTQLGSLFARTGTNRQPALLAYYYGGRWSTGEGSGEQA